MQAGDIVARRDTVSRTDDVPIELGTNGVVVSIDDPHPEAGRLKPRPVLVAWNDGTLLRRHFEFELEVVGHFTESLVLRVMERLVERVERGI